ncbi:HPr family phosphocarrier protein [Alteribacillus sp. HJP-4]|uniref:HPr family phosphocarrier protein n=1 Tax=Alteribacillus sp. HJP-4 TaxID=2775394 RepID=UPI0035CCC95D
MSEKLVTTAYIHLEEKTYFDKLTAVANYANRFESNIELELNSKKVNGKSIVALTSFLTPSELVTLRAVGRDSKEAVHQIKKIFMS